MPILEIQLDTWAHQGSIAQSSSTYNSIKRVLETPTSPFASRSYNVFLQGSYGNDTNIYSESDVDIVICTDECYYYDLAELTTQEKEAYNDQRTPAGYCYEQFHEEVLQWLYEKYGSSVNPGSKAIKIEANGTRRNADILICTEYRRYYQFKNFGNGIFDVGICFFDSKGTMIANYPKQHSVNCTTKHKASALWFKPFVRIMKNLRSKLVSDGLIKSGSAPSYYLEGMLYSVPDGNYGKSYRDTFVNCMTWLQNADYTQLQCANEQYILLHSDSPVTWRVEQFNEFLKAAIELWNEW